MPGYPSKAFKVSPFYKALFQACTNIYGIKSPLVNGLVKGNFDSEEYKEIPSLGMNTLFEMMINDLKQEIQNHDYEKLKSSLLEDQRISELKEIFESLNISIMNPRLYFRCEPNCIQTVYQMAIHTLREVIEMAISLFILKCSSIEYSLIQLFISNYEVEAEPK